MAVRLPSRYEDLDEEFRGRLRPNQSLLEAVKSAFQSMEISGGIRFLPIYGESGSGKTSATLELGTHLPELKVLRLSREAIESNDSLRSEVASFQRRTRESPIVAVVDQYEEVAAQRQNIPSAFVEQLSLIDRGDLRSSRILFVWITTSGEFQKQLSDATSRNRRILISDNFELRGPDSRDWPGIIQETFQFHNKEKTLSDYEVIDTDLSEIINDSSTIGSAIERVGDKLSKYTSSLHDLSTYLVVMLWPVTDGLRITRIQQFSDARQGYKLDWNAYYRQLNADDQRQLPLKEYNRARLYFDMRLVPIAAADLHPLCRDLDNERFALARTYLDRFANTHLFSVASGKWSAETFAPLRERESQRATQAREWYDSVTQQPTKIGRRLAKVFNELGLSAEHEKEITSPNGRVRADVLIDRTPITPPNVVIEIKAFSAENTMPSTICQAVTTTLRRHAQFAGFLQRQ